MAEEELSRQRAAWKTQMQGLQAELDQQAASHATEAQAQASQLSQQSVQVEELQVRAKQPRKKQNKAYTVRRHKGSLCPQTQPTLV